MSLPIFAGATARRQVRRHRRENIAAMKRLAHRLAGSTSPLVISRTLCFSRAKIMESTPLSGATKYWPAASTRIGRRDVPTPGSTTTTCTVRAENSGRPARSGKAPSAISIGAHLVADIHDLRLRADAQDHALHGADVVVGRPKSVVRVRMGRRIVKMKVSAALLLRPQRDHAGRLPKSWRRW